MKGVNRSSKQLAASSGREVWGYTSDYHVRSSWVPRGDTLRDSMVAYSKKMTDVRRIRGIHVPKSHQSAEVSPALIVSTGRSSFDLLSMSEDSGKRFYSNNRLTRALGSIKLEPLLGSQKSTYKAHPPDLNKTVTLQVKNMKKERARQILSNDRSSSRVSMEMRCR